MHGITTGDGLRSLVLGRAYAATKQRLSGLTSEIATGRKADPAHSLRGQTQGLSGLRHRLQLIESYRLNTTETAMRLETMQSALSDMQGLAAKSSHELLAATGQGAVSVNAVLADAAANLDRAISMINANVSGRFVFSGSLPHSPAVSSADDIMGAVLSRVGGMTSAQDVIAAVDDFFNAPAGGGGFIDMNVSGDPGSAGPTSISDTDKIVVDTTAASTPIRDLLLGNVLAVLAQRGTPSLDMTGMAQLVDAAGARLGNASTGLTGLESQNGTLEARVEYARVRNEAEQSSVERALGSLLGADPYETSVALTDEQARLETLYAITARLSRMSLADRI